MRGCGGGAEAGGCGAAVGDGVASGVLDAGDQDSGGLAGGGQFALGGCFLEELVGFVAAGFGVGEDCGEGRPAGVGEDPLGVLGDCGSYVAGQGATGLLLRLALREFCEVQGEGVAGGALKVLEGMAGGVGLVGVALGLVPASRDDRGPDKRCDQGGEGAAVGAGGGVRDVAGRVAQSVGGSVFCPDLGALGACERLRGGLEFSAQVDGGFLGGGFDQITERGDVGLGSCVVGEVGV